jgi:hypothetical protein
MKPQQAILPGLSDQQMEAVVRAAQPLDPGKRGVLLTRLLAHLKDSPPDLPDVEFEALLQAVSQCEAWCMPSSVTTVPAVSSPSRS